MLRVLPALLVLALLIYLVIRFAMRRGEGGGGGRGGLPRRPLAPDDDPTFLRDLDSKVWEQQQEERRAREEQEREQEPPAS